MLPAQNEPKLTDTQKELYRVLVNEANHKKTSLNFGMLASVLENWGFGNSIQCIEARKVERNLREHGF